MHDQLKFSDFRSNIRYKDFEHGYGIWLSNSPQTYRIKRFGVWIYVL